jgi:hypothetical protein
MSFPLSKHTGEGDTAPAFSVLCVCLQLTWEVGLPPSPVSFPPSATLTSFPAPGCWARTPAPARDSLARPGLFIYSSGKDSLPPLFGTRCTPPSLQCVFIVLSAYYSVSLFSPGGGQSVQGAMLIWPRVVCGSTTYHLVHLVVCIFPSLLGVRGPSWFLHLT